MNIEDIDTTKWDFTDDGWGGIDIGIKKCVIFLNLLGINTVGSCSGHPERSNNVIPYITISSSDVDNDDNWSKEEDDRLRVIIEKLLQGFYEDRDTSDLKKLTLDVYPTMFSLHNGGELWTKWREEVNDRVLCIKNGEVVKRRILSEEEIQSREIISKELLSEFDDFTDYLAGIYSRRLGNKN